MKRISIKNKLLLNSIITIVFTIVMISIGFFEFNRSIKLSNHIAPLSKQMAEFVKLKSHFEYIELILEEYFLIGGDRYKIKVKDTFDNIFVSIEHLERHGYKLNLFEEMKNKTLTLNDLIADLLNKKMHPISNRVQNELLLNIYSEFKELGNLQSTYYEQSFAMFNTYIEEQQEGLKNAIFKFFILGIIIVIFYLFYGLTLSNRISSPLLKLTKAATKIYEGNFDIEVPTGNDDEIGDLAKIFNKMAIQIQKSINDLKNSEARFRSVVETAVDAIISINSNGEIIFWNKAAQNHFGYSVEEVEGKPMSLIIPERFQKNHHEGMKKILAGGSSKVIGRMIEVVGRRKDGTEFPMELSLAMWMIKEALFITAIISNISERKMIENALTENEQKYRSIFENSPMAIVHFDKFGVVTACNNHLCEILGSSQNKLIGLNTMKSLKDEMMIDTISKALSGHKSYYEGEYLSVTGGVRTPIRAIFAPIFSGNGEVKGAMGILENISKQLSAEQDKMKLESQLQQSQKMEAIGTLAGGIAHDFNNILFPMIGYTEMLIEDLPQGGELQENAKEVFLCALRAKELVKQILAFSRQGDQELRPVRLQSILKEVLKLLGSSIPKTIDIQTDIDSHCGMVIADPTQIHQIIMNLATNAYHAMQETGGLLKVTLKQTEIELEDNGFLELIPGEYVLLVVTDTGTGIKKEIIEKIFDPYFTTKAKDRGTGLGLSVVQGIVKSCNGDIRVYSEPDKGTEIRVYLPIIKKIAEDMEPDIIKPIQGGSERILLVDDEEAIIKMEEQMLKRLGYFVTVRTGSIEALKVFKAKPDEFDLIISDMTMPDITGIQLAKEIKSIRPDIPFIICTGFSDQINEKTTRESDIQGYVTKPVLKRKIAHTVRDVLDKSYNPKED